MKRISCTTKFMSLSPFFSTTNMQKILSQREASKCNKFTMGLADMPSDLHFH